MRREAPAEGCGNGRAQFLVFHAHITDDTVIAAAQDALDALADVPGLIPMEPDDMHISIRAVGFQVIEKRREDEVLRQDVGPVAERAAKIAKRAAPADVTIGPPNVFPDALILEVHDDTAALASLRRELAAATAIDAFGLDAEWTATNQLRIQVGAAHYMEDRQRPDAAAFDWTQTRVHARVTLILRSGTDAMPLPPALRTPPRAGSR